MVCATQLFRVWCLFLLFLCGFAHKGEGMKQKGQCGSAQQHLLGEITPVPPLLAHPPRSWQLGVVWTLPETTGEVSKKILNLESIPGLLPDLCESQIKKKALVCRQKKKLV